METAIAQALAQLEECRRELAGLLAPIEWSGRAASAAAQRTTRVATTTTATLDTAAELLARAGDIAVRARILGVGSPR